MLEPIIWRENGEVRRFNQLVQYSDRLPSVFRQRLEQLQAVHRWLAGYFQAVGILLQIPGATEYRCTDDERTNFWDFIWTRDTRMTLTFLAAVLGQLEAEELMAQVPGGTDYRPRRLPRDVQTRLAGLDVVELIDVVAACLDRLLVVPELLVEAEHYGIDPLPGRGWWPFGRQRSAREPDPEPDRDGGRGAEP